MTNNNGLKCIFYQYITENMIRYADVNRKLDYSKAKFVLGLLKVPKWMRSIVIHEMIEYGYLIRHKKRELEIIEREYDKNRFLGEEDEEKVEQKV